jgi:hypothetical protein
MVREGQTYKIMPIARVFLWTPTQVESNVVELQKQSRHRTRSEDQESVNEIGAIGFETIAAAGEAIAVLPGATVSDQGGFKIVDESDGVTHWRLSTEAVFKVVITTAPDGTLEVKASGLCEGSQLNCEKLLATWSMLFRTEAEYVQARAAGCPRASGFRIKR